MTQSGQAKVYVKQGATEQVIDAGGYFNAASGAVLMPGSLAKGYIDLGPYIFQARKMASGETLTTASGSVIDPDVGSVALTSTGDQSLYVGWASAAVNGIKLPPIAMPGDMSTAGGVTIGLYGETVGSASAADTKDALDIRCWMDVGDTEMGSTHPDFTSTPALRTITLTSANVSTGILNITLVPEAHAARAIRLYGGRIGYTKKTS
jgi:hypothetical protein